MSPHLEFIRDCPEWGDEVITKEEQASFTPEAWRAFLNWAAEKKKHKGGVSLEEASKWAGENK